MAFEFFHGSFDAYIQNSNNYYLYKDPKKDRFVYIPWDYDYTLGSGPVTMDAITVGDYNDFPGLYVRPLTTAILNVPLYRQIFEGQLNAIGKLYNPEVSFPIIDSIADFIRDDVKWDLSLKRVKRGVNLIPFGTRHSISDFVHRNASDDSGGLPITFSLVNVLDYLARVNLDVPFDDAVEGPTGHSSLFGIKEWFKVKYDNFLNKTPYKSGILNSPLHIL
jgi:hypothetical protein